MRHDRDPDSYMPSSASEEEDEDMDHEVSDDEDDVDDAPSVWMGGDGDVDAEDVDGDVDAEEEDGDAFASILLSMGATKSQGQRCVQLGLWLDHLSAGNVANDHRYHFESSQLLGGIL